MSSSAAALDTETPNAARAYDYLLGGKLAFAADREMVARISALYPKDAPGPKQLAAANRTFLEMAVDDALRDEDYDAGQILDLGAGFPAPKPLHVVAREARASARCCYVDIDPRVVDHGTAATAGIHGVTYANADLTQPGEVMANRDVRSVIDPDLPVVAVFGLTLHFLPAGDAQQVIEGWTRRLPSGSRFAVTVAHWPDDLMWQKVRAVYRPAPLYNHPAAQVAGMMRGLDILGGGKVVTARGWGPEVLEQCGPGKVLAVVARKP